MTQKKALIAWGGWEGHTPLQSSEITKNILEEHQLEVDVVEGTSTFSDPDLSRYDLIIPVITMSSIEKEEVANLCQTVENGTGLAGFHGCMCDSFRDSVDYQFMTGGQWVAHPGNIIDFTVQIIPSDESITNGIQDFDFRSEQYYMHVDPSNEVLAATTFSGEHCSWIKDVTMPVVWKRTHGIGRVFYSALGHIAEEFQVPEMATLFTRGMLWATRH